MCESGVILGLAAKYQHISANTNISANPVHHIADFDEKHSRRWRISFHSQQVAFDLQLLQSNG